MITSPVHCPRMVGRRKELDFVIERSLAAAQGQGSIVLVEGEAGSGKTRLLREFSLEVERRGLRHLAGSCFEYAKAPFAPLVAAIRGLLRADPGCVPDVQSARALLARLIPEPSEVPPAAPSVDGSEKLQHFELLVGVLRKAAEDRPTVVTIEDIHWGDSATLEFIQHAARIIGGTFLCIVCTYRADELARGHPLRSAVAKLDREPAVWRLELAPLGDDEMQSFIAEAVPERAAISAQTALAIRQRSEGNPFFAEELLRSALSQARTATSGRDLPRSVREAVVERLSKLNDVDRTLIVTAAAIGRRFTPEFLAKVSGVPLDEVASALKRAIDLQLIAENIEQGTLEFRHALTREAVYSELLGAESRVLHKRIARAIEESTDARESVSELAFQWWSAGEREKAADYNERAGDAAERLYASQDAALYYSHALDATDKGSPSLGFLQRKLARALHQSGMGARAQSTYEAAIETFLAKNDFDEAAAALISLAGLLFTLQNVAGHRAATRRALELIGDRKTSPIWFAAHVQMAWTKYLNEPDEAARLLDEAERFPANASSADRARLYECRALIEIPQGRSSEALESATKASTIALDAKDVASAVRCWGNVGVTAALCGDRALSEQAFRHANVLIKKERPAGWPVPWALALQANAQFLYGQLAEAESTVTRALSAILDFPSLDALVAWVALPLGVRLENRALVDRCADEDLIEYAFSSGSTLIGDVASAFFEYYLAGNRLTEGIALLGRALDTLRAAPAPGDYDSMFVQIAQYCDKARVDRAEELLRQMATVIRVRSVPAHQALVQAWAAKRFGDPREAARLALHAAQLFEALEWPIYRAQALEVANQIDKAREIYRKVGDRADVRRLEQLIPLNRQGRRRDQLSKRELEIARLVVNGKSNREIAETLVVSERTVETHVSSIFGKLQISSRRQLADRLKASEPQEAKGT